jgi:hypothetical protein
MKKLYKSIDKNGLNQDMFMIKAELILELIKNEKIRFKLIPI